jgi:DNA-binding CsgD family transcriptional regulator
MKINLLTTSLRLARAIMLICMGFFGWDVINDITAHLQNGNSYTQWELIHTIFETFAVLGLGLGAYALSKYFRLLQDRTLTQAQTITLLRGQFHLIMQEKFAAWGLTSAERDVTALLLKGMKLPEISTARQTAIGTIKAQSSAVYRKIGVSSRAELMSIFMDEFLEPAPQIAANSANNPTDGRIDGQARA